MSRMKCPACRSFKNTIIDTRPSARRDNVRRRRECLNCGQRFSTYEVAAEVFVDVTDRAKEIEEARQTLIDEFAAKLPVSPGQRIARLKVRPK